jgi:sec-independent protein translocase protein TatA
MFGLGPMELMIVGVVAVLLFGKRLPEIGRSMGKSIVEFKKGMRDGEDDAQAEQQKLPT